MFVKGETMFREEKQCSCEGKQCSVRRNTVNVRKQCSCEE